MSRSAPATFDGFVHAEGGRLVDGRGQPRLLRGVGLGNWLLPEGYMWRFDQAGPQSPRQIEALIADLVGTGSAASFWRTFRDRFVAEADIERIAAEGFDHVRVPINSRLVIDDGGRLLEEGLALIDRLIDWCRWHRLWIVLDLHGAPGGQTGTNIDDSPRGLPDLFIEGGRYRDLALRLWEGLAHRYRDEPVVAGYDLLNEPLPNEYQDRYASQLLELYRELTARVRTVDPNHLIIYEGTHWSTNWSIFTEVLDPNSMLQFHKYWSPPDGPSVAGYIEIGERLGLPIYMGEGGENNLAWLQTAFQLYEDRGISWNFWSWKKLATRTSPCSVRPPSGWDDIVAFAAGRGARPSPDDSRRALDRLLDAIRFDACEYRPEVMNSLLRRTPLRVPALGFGFGGAGVSYETRDARPLPGFRADDRVTIRSAAGEGVPLNFHHPDGRDRASEEALEVVLGVGDWVAYDVEVPAPSRIRLRVRLSSADASSVDGGAPELCIDGTIVEAGLSDGKVEGVTPTLVSAGRHVVRLTARGGACAIDWIEMTPVA